MCVERPVASTSLLKVQYRILPQLRGYYTNIVERPYTIKNKQMSMQMSSKYDYFVCISFYYLPKNKKVIKRLSKIRHALQGKSRLCIPFLGIARPQPPISTFMCL